MALQKQNLSVPFGQGLDTKTDPFQVAPGRFISLENVIFNTGNLLTKRNGFPNLTALSDDSTRLAATFNGNLLAIGDSVQAYSSAAKTWTNKGTLQPVSLSANPLYRSSTNQTQADAAVAPNNLVCTAFTDAGSYRYVISDATTGQVFLGPTALASANTAPRVFVLGNYFIVVYGALITATQYIKYVAINYNTLAVNAVAQITAQYSMTSTGNFDGVVANDTLYLAWNATDGGNAVRVCYLTQFLSKSSDAVIATGLSTYMSVCADTSGSTPVIWVTFANTVAGGSIFSNAYNQALTTITSASFSGVGTVKNLATAATGLIISIFFELDNGYTYDSAIKTNYIRNLSVHQVGGAYTNTLIARSVGLASKAFVIDSTRYFLAAYNSAYQPSYFLMNESGQVLGKIAYQNGGGYLTTGLPNVTVTDDVAYIPYLYKDLVTAVNKTQGSTVVAGVYTQTGINLSAWTFSTPEITTSEIGGNLHVSGGILWTYDGREAVEQNFNLYPEYIEATTATTTGLMTAQIYYYYVTYEWTDASGNTHRSAPSIPLKVDISASMTSTNKVTLDIPTLRLSYKTNIRVVVYRWSTGQQTPYQITSVTSPTLNDATVDYIVYVDTVADSSILGNNILYTNGGAVEDIGPPAIKALTVYRSRLFALDAEDPNLIWFSKQVIEATPVEMSDLFTIYVPPQVSAQGTLSNGPLSALASMDDKLIIFRSNSIAYTAGQGPDNTGANNDFSDPVHVTSVVGCSNADSIVQMPEGIMFQSDKGIWILKRDLSTSYIGSPVEAYNNATVTSAVAVPKTNQIRFTLDTGIQLVYDYFYNQWATFTGGVSAISSCIFEDFHTLISDSGQVRQERPGTYIDAPSNPVLMKIKTGWYNLAGLQGYQRAYEFNLLGRYLSPHMIHMEVAYDFADGPSQSCTFTPNNFVGPWGSNAGPGDITNPGNYGQGGVWGGSSLEEARCYFETQECESFQVTLQEVYDSSYGLSPGAGFTLSGINFIYGYRKGQKPRPAANSVG